MAILRRQRRSINTLELVHIISFLVIVEGVFMLVPLVTSIAYGEDDYMAFLIAIAVCALIGVGSFMLPRARTRDLSKRDGMLLTVSVWIVFSLVGMIPFMASSLRLGFCDAFFESMSGFTTTGASVMDDIERLPYGLHLWRSMMQWIGGVGIILFTVALLPMLNSSGGMQMVNAELSGITRDKLRPRVSQTAMRLWLIYSILTAVLTAALWLGPMSFFDSICHAFSTVSTGGFSTSNDSIGAWDSLYVRLVIIVFMFIGGMSFAMIYRASLGKVRSVLHDDNFKTYLYMVLGFTGFFSLVLIVQGGFSSVDELVIDPLFQVVSLATSTGYIDADFSRWTTVVVPVVMFLIFCGACAGSTSGGVKIDRIICLGKNLRNEISKFIHPNRFYPLVVNGEVRPQETIVKIAGFMTVYLLVLVAGGMLLGAMGLPMTDSFFSIVSCLGNNGLGWGVTAESFAAVPDAGKMILAFWMLIGRLEILTVVVIFTRGFWRK